MRLHDLRRYSDLPGAAWSRREAANLRRNVWAHRLPSGWVTGATDGHVLVAVPGTLTGARLLDGQAPAVLSCLEQYAAEQLYPYAAELGPLREWAGSPGWPAVWPWECRECHGAGEVDCHVDPCAGADCPHAEDCCEWTYTCPCSRYEGIRPGLLLGAVVDRTLLARVLDLPLGPRIYLAWGGSLSPFFLTDGHVRAVVMPLRWEDEDEEPVPFPGAIEEGGAP